jgi:hypothetical protein
VSFREVVIPSALLRHLIPRRPLDDTPWEILGIEDLYYRSTATIQHNVTGERFEVIVRKLVETTHVPWDAAEARGRHSS